jgi:hypothetical protein
MVLSVIILLLLVVTPAILAIDVATEGGQSIGIMAGAKEALEALKKLRADKNFSSNDICLKEGDTCMVEGKQGECWWRNGRTSLYCTL